MATFMAAVGAAAVAAYGGVQFYRGYRRQLLYVRELTAEEKSRRPEFKGMKYVAVRPLSQTVAGRPVTVKPGFVCDGASSIGVDHLFEEHWLVHDWLYATHKDDNGVPMTQAEADSVLSWWRHAAVWAFGSKAWRESGQRGALFVSP
jgi:hypothetical protein